MHGSISSFGDDSAHKKRAQRAQQHTHPSARASHLPSPTPPPCSTTVALRQLGAYTCLQHASAFERRSTRPTHRLPHSPHTRERRRPHAHDARHASALRASHSFGRAPLSGFMRWTPVHVDAPGALDQNRKSRHAAGTPWLPTALRDIIAL